MVIYVIFLAPFTAKNSLSDFFAGSVKVAIVPPGSLLEFRFAGVNWVGAPYFTIRYAAPEEGEAPPDLTCTVSQIVFRISCKPLTLFNVQKCM